MPQKILPMLSLLLYLVGAFPFYRRSKYFPVQMTSLSPRWGYLFLLGAFLAAVVEFGAAVGAVVGVANLMLAYSILVFVFPLSKFYRVGFGILLLLSTFIHYACTK